MSSLTREYLENLAITPELLGLATRVSEYKGKQALFQRQIPQVLETLREHAIIQSTESSNRLEGIVVASRRLESLVRGSVAPENRSEGEIAGYRDVLGTIQQHFEHMGVTPNVILQLHRDLMQYTGMGGVWKSVDNIIEERLPTVEVRVRFRPTPAWRTEAAMEELCNNFDSARRRSVMPDYVLVALFVLDFLCIHPFSDGNGRMARLLTLLLLSQSGYVVGRYIGLERVVEDTKEQYYDTLEISSRGWHDGEHNSGPWIEYFLTLLNEAYHRFEERVGNVEQAQKKGWKHDRIVQVVHGFVADFSVADIEEQCPGISRPTIAKTLNELGRQGIIQCIERGRHAKWIRCR